MVDLCQNGIYFAIKSYISEILSVLSRRHAFCYYMGCKANGEPRTRKEFESIDTASLQKK